MVATELTTVGELMTLREAAKVKGVSINALYLWLRRKHAPVQIIGHTLLVSPTTLESYNPRSK